MKRMKFSLIIVFILIMVSLLGTNLPPAVVAQPPTPLVLMCQRLGPDPVSVGDVIPFIAAVNDIDAWYYWEWTVNGTPEESSNTTYFASYFNFSRSVPGVYEVCVNVTGSSGKKDGPCCDSVTVVGPSLKIEKTGPGTVNAGDPLSYTITVTNNGSDIATGVIVVDDYDQGVLIITPTHGGADNGDTITWSGGSIAAGDFLSYTITADVKSTAPGGKIFYNYADVTCDEGVSDSTSIVTTVVGLPLVLMCQRLGPEQVSACNGEVIPFLAAVNDIDAWYYWEWAVNETPEESSNTTDYWCYFNFSRSVPGVYDVCVNVTGSSGKKDGPCCNSVTVNPALSLELSPATDTNLVNTYHNITATVLDCGDPQSGVNVTWDISASVVGSFFGMPDGITNDAGKAYALITSSQPGRSTVTCAVTEDTDISDTAIKDWTAETPPSGGGGGGGGCPEVKYLEVDWDGNIDDERLLDNDELEEDLLGSSPDGSHSLLLEQGTHAPIVDGETYYLITIRELELKDIPPRPGNTVAILAFNITPTDAVFNKDITLTLGFYQSQLPQNALEETLRIAYYDDVSGAWVQLESTQGELDGMLTISAAMDHFTIFAVLVDVAPPSPPAAHFKASGLNIVTSVEKIWESVTFVTKTGESVTIMATITNDGGQEGTDTIELKLDGETEGTEAVTLGVGQSQQVSFTVTGLDYGQHEVKVIGESGEFTTERAITWWLIIVIIVAIGLIIWGVIWWRRRRRKAQQAA